MARLSLCCLVVGLLLTGCGGGGDKVQTHKVKGKVTYNGSPVAGATVTFSPQEKGSPAALGITDAQGIYTLTTYDSGDGAAAGLYKVLVYKITQEESPATSATSHDPTGADRSARPAHSGSKAGQKKASGSLLPEKYAKVDTTTLNKNVVGGDNEINLEL